MRINRDQVEEDEQTRKDAVLDSGAVDEKETALRPLRGSEASLSAHTLSRLMHEGRLHERHEQRH